MLHQIMLESTATVAAFTYISKTLLNVTISSSITLPSFKIQPLIWAVEEQILDFTFPLTCVDQPKIISSSMIPSSTPTLVVTVVDWSSSPVQLKVMILKTLFSLRVASG